jgi:long-chain acyl-CoA synthetase
VTTSPSPTPPGTLNELFLGAIARYRERPVAMRWKPAGASWTPISFQQLLERVRATSLALARLGVKHGDRVAILSENRPEWAIVDYAVLALGAVDVPVYPTLPTSQVEYILRDAGASVAFASTQHMLDKLLEVRPALPGLRHIVAFDPSAHGPGVLAFGELETTGRALPTDGWEAAALLARPDDLATIIYTSGTTGNPKGVMLSHGNITSNVISGLMRIPIQEDPSQQECLSFLPLSHIFERMAGHYLMTHAGAIINYAGSIDTVSTDMGEIRPTLMCSVPRLYEKIYGRVQENAMAGSAIKRQIFRWAKRVGETCVDLTLAGKPVPLSLAAQRGVADRLVFRKLRDRTGNRLRFFVSGGAPLNADIARFFLAAGLPILEGYGLTETSPVISVNTFKDLRLGTVGKLLPGVEVKIAADGEIVTRGPNVMKGYYNNPDATREVLDPDGWFRTGDIGEIDADGFLRITDRKKDLIVTSGGKNIAPQPIENIVRTSKWVLNAVMLGDRRAYPIMLVVPNIALLREWARRHAYDFVDDDALLARAETHEKIEREVKRMLRDLARYEVPKRLVLVKEDFSVEAGELTPTLKVRRRIVEQRYKERIEAAYLEGPGGQA